MLLCGKNLDPDIWNCNFEGMFCNVFLKIRPVSRKTYSINDATNAKIDSVVFRCVWNQMIALWLLKFSLV